MEDRAVNAWKQIDFRGVAVEELAKNWSSLSDAGRKELLARTTNRRNHEQDEATRKHLSDLCDLLSTKELQRTVDILAGHGQISGLYHAAVLNTGATFS